MLKSHEVLGTDLPIFREQEAEYLTFEEILHVNEKPDHYERCGYVQFFKFQKVFYKPVYKPKA